MKTTFVFLLALLVAPAWADDATVAMLAEQQPVQVVETAPDAMPDANLESKDTLESLLGRSKASEGSALVIGNISGVAPSAGCPVGCALTTCSGVTACFKRGCKVC